MTAAVMERQLADTLVEDHVVLARKIAFDYLSKAPRHTDADEIVSAAFLGLVEAASRFDPDAGVPFGRWASARITGSIVDAARAADPLSRRARTNVRDLQRLEEQMTSASGAAPADEDLAARAGLPVDRVRKLRQDLHAGVVVSLDEAMPGGVETFATQLIDADPGPLETLERREVDAYLADAVATLPERLREVVEGHFHRGETNVQIAERLGVTPQRVSQLRSEALRVLRTGMEAQYPTEETRPPGGVRPVSSTASYAAAAAARQTYARRLGSL